MTFESDKQKYLDELYKPDRSKKGNVDLEIAHIIDRINEHKNLYTTSSCAGRIDLLKVPKSGKKNEAEWLFVSHAEIKYEDIVPAIKKIQGMESKEKNANPESFDNLRPISQTEGLPNGGGGRGWPEGFLS